MFWADEIANEIIKTRGTKNRVASGITPSGPIHLGNLREIMTAQAIHEGLQKNGSESELIYIADDFDRLRKLYPFMPEEYTKYVGFPISNIPDPWGCHPFYPEHFLEPFFTSIEKLGVKVTVLSAAKMYQSGQYTEVIKIALEKRDQIAAILEEVSKRELPKDWSPFDPLCKSCGRIEQAKITEYDLENNKVKYQCSCGHNDWADFSKGEGKLSWRVDWPARWKMLGITVEPFGKDHGTVGGSYDTGKRISKEIFDYDPPFPASYEFITLKGSKGKMASSVGNVVSAEDMLEIVPPQLVRYILYRVPFNRAIDFDPAQGLVNIVDEYSRLEAKYNEANGEIPEADLYKYCQITKSDKTIPQIPFRHLVMAVQAGQGKLEEIKRILMRTEHNQPICDDDLLKEQIKRTQNWLEKYAPDQMKFSLQEKLPASAKDLSDDQKKFLHTVLEKLENIDAWDGELIHTTIHDIKNEQGIAPKEAFCALYRIFIDKDSGPQAGWFLGSLDKEFVINRLKEIN